MKKYESKIKICFVVRGLTKGGVRRFILNVLNELDNNSKYEVYIIHNEKELENKYKHIKTKFIKTKNKMLFDYFCSFNFFLFNKFDVIIYPKNVIPLNHFFLRGKKINIIHDLGYFEKKINAYPFLDTLFMKTFMKLSCKLGNKVLAVSNATKKDIIKRFNISKDKIKVIHEGIEPNFKVIKNNKVIEKTLKKYDVNKPFIFYSGSISPRKNISRILEAYKNINTDLKYELIITGLKKWSHEEIETELNKKSNKKIKLLGYVSEEELIHLYNSAELYLYPSLYEGFGLPILEAQACGCPVITSNLTSMPEVAGEGAILVDPYNTKQIEKAIVDILSNKELKNELINKGFNNIKRFSWKKTTDKIINECNK